MNMETEIKQEMDVMQEKEPLTWGKALLFYASYMGLTVIIGVGLGMVLTIWDTVMGKDMSDTVLTRVDFILLLDGMAFFLVLLLFKSVRMFLKGSFSFAPLKQGKTYLYLFVGFVALFVVQFLIMGVFQWEDGSDQIATFQLNSISLEGLSLFVCYLAFAVVTPIKEEILYRGLLHGFLAKKINFWAGLIVSSAIFGALHTGHALSAGLMGLVLVLLYRFTGSLIVPILFHMIWNVYAVSGLLAYAGQTL